MQAIQLDLCIPSCTCLYMLASDRLGIMASCESENEREQRSAKVLDPAFSFGLRPRAFELLPGAAATLFLSFAQHVDSKTITTMITISTSLLTSFRIVSFPPSFRARQSPCSSHFLLWPPSYPPQSNFASVPSRRRHTLIIRSPPSYSHRQATAVWRAARVGIESRHKQDLEVHGHGKEKEVYGHMSQDAYCPCVVADLRRTLIQVFMGGITFAPNHMFSGRSERYCTS